MEFCGSGSLPTVISSRPEVLVTLTSAPNQILYNSRFELDVAVKLERVHETASVRRKGICDFTYDASQIANGVIQTPQHSIPANTSCTYTFVSPNPADRVRIYFLSYFVPDKHQWSNQEHCDVSRLEIYDFRTQMQSTETNDSLTKTSSSLPSASHSPTTNVASSSAVVFSFCEKTAPKICGRAADADNYLPLNPCIYHNESYLSTANVLIIKQHYYRPYENSVQKAGFTARFEFVSVNNKPDDGSNQAFVHQSGLFFSQFFIVSLCFFTAFLILIIIVVIMFIHKVVTRDEKGNSSAEAEKMHQESETGSGSAWARQMPNENIFIFFEQKEFWNFYYCFYYSIVQILQL